MQLTVAADILLVSTALAYAGAAGLFFARLAKRGVEHDALGRRAELVFGVGALLHFGYFMLTAAIEKACPVEGIHQAASLTGLVTGTMFLFVSRAKRLDAIGAFIAPIALAALLSARFVGGAAPPIKSAVLPFHVTSILVASALFAVSSALAATYLFQEKQLKQKRKLGLLQGLPPLDVLERASHRFLLAGFPLLTLGILTGLLFVGRLNAGDPSSRAQLLRQILAYAAWVCFAGVLFMRSAAGWRGRRAAWGTLVGFGCAVLVFVVYLVRDRAGHG